MILRRQAARGRVSGYGGFWLGFLALLGLFFACAGHGAVIDVPAEAERLPLGAAMEYFLDEGGQLAPEAAMRDGRYRAAGGDSLTFGFSAAVLWVRLTLRNPSDAAIERWLHLEPVRLERVSLFLPESGGLLRLENGLQVAVAQRSVPTRRIVFPLRLEARASVTMVLRVQSRTRLSLLPMLWTPSAFERAMQHEDLLAMLSIGALLGLSLYTIALFPLRRDGAALWLGLTMFSACLFDAAYNGYDYAYWWPDRPEWSLRAAAVFLLLAQAGFNRFIKAFVPIRVFGWRWAGHWLDGLLLADLALLLPLLFSTDYQEIFLFHPFLSLACQLSYLSIGLAALRKGFRPAGYLIAGLSIIYSLAIAPRPGGPYDWLLFSNLSLNFQSMMAAVMFVGGLLFHAAISQQVDLLRREKDKALAEALAIQTETAASMEAQVARRTAQLRAAKERAEQADRAKGEFLARVSHELRTPLHTILGYAHLLRRDAADARSEERLALLEEGGGHLAKLIDDLLDYARGERGGLALHPEAVFFIGCWSGLKDMPRP